MYDRTIDYNAQGQVSRELVTQRQGSDTIVSETWNEYHGALGAVTGSTTNTWKKRRLPNDGAYRHRLPVVGRRGGGARHVPAQHGAEHDLHHLL
jgi:hypothetical protein